MGTVFYDFGYHFPIHLLAVSGMKQEFEQILFCSLALSVFIYHFNNT